MHDSPPCVLSARLSILAASLSQRRARASDGWDASAASRVPDALRHAMPLREKPGPSSISPRTSSAPQPRCAASGERVAVIARSTSCDEAIQPFGRGLWIASELALLAMTEFSDGTRFHLTAFLAREVICPSCHCVAGAYACDDGQITGTSSRVSRFT